MKKEVIVVFLALIVISPWFLIFSRNWRLFIPKKTDFYQLNSPQFISEINTFQGEAAEAGIKGWGKLTVNKGTWFVKDILTRYLESFDFHFLFIEGDLNIQKTTRASGPIYLSLIPAIAYGFYFNLKKKKYLLLLTILALPLLGALIGQHYETFSRLPFILGLTLLAAQAIALFSKAKGYRVAKLIFVFLLFFEYARFVHYYFLHYPYLLSGR
jgi:hypothetical protein